MADQEVTPKAAVVPETMPDAAAPERPAQDPAGKVQRGARNVSPEPDVPDEDVPPAIPTGFPEPAQDVTPQPRKEPRPGYVTLATQPPMGDLTVPPLEGGGETVAITADGTEVDGATALRAHEAARLAGFTLRQT